MDLANLIVAALVLLGTLVLIWLTVLLVRPKRPSLRLDQLRLDLFRFGGGFVQVGEDAEVRLIFVNDGPGIAPALNAYVRGAVPGNADEFQFPADGSPTVAVGERFEVPIHVKIIERPDGFPFRRYTHGDDYYFDLTGVRIRFEWGIPGKRQVKLVDNIHALQQHASPQVEPPPSGWEPSTSPAAQPPRV